MVVIIAHDPPLTKYSGSGYQTLSRIRPIQASQALTSPLLELRQLSCERDERVLFDQLSVHCHEGDLLQVSGPNGSGKTTLLRVLAGISNSYRGEILWRGQALPRARWDYGCDLLYLGHQPGIKKALTPLENLNWYNALNAPAVSQIQLLRALAHVGLEACADTPCYQLSAGQMRRVALARLYLSQASIWILDEPFTAIDKGGVAQLEQRFRQHAAQGGAVIFTSHQDLLLPKLRHIHLLSYLPEQAQTGPGAAYGN